MFNMGRRLVVWGAAMSLLVAGSLVDPAAASSSVVFVVNSTADRGAAVLNGVCQTSVAGECTLRAAIQEADVTAGPVTIDFAIPGSGVQQISPQTVLPPLNNGTYGITIDGFSQPGAAVNTDPLVDNATRLIELAGLGPTSFNGLVFLGSHNVMRGIDMHGFVAEVVITGTSASHNVIEGDLLGLLPDGNLDPGYTGSRINGNNCVDVNSSNANNIGLPSNANRNVISGCFNSGVSFNNAHTGKNFVQNNIIGLDPSGTQRRGNESMGVDHDWGVTGTMVGGTAYEQRNVISGNLTDGVQISHGAGQIHNSVVGNYIGTDPTGTFASPATVNSHIGVYLEGKPNCNTKPCPPDEGYETVTDNVIVNSGFGGVMANKGTHDSLIARNRIGVTLNGTLASNTQFGVMVATGATHITIANNEIAGNQYGIQMTPLGVLPVNPVSSPTEYNTITQNSIHDNVNLGIDFLPYGQVNQNGDGDPNVNQGIDVPILTASAGVVNAQTCASCTVELFASNGSTTSFGPGVTYLLTAVADSTGLASFSAPSGGWPAVVTATTTTTLGSSSEYAQNIVP